MKIRIHRFSGITLLAISMLLVTAAQAIGAESKKQVAVPDFTKGDKIPEGADHDWNLGATGLRGWIYANQMSTADARQIYVTRVDEDSPADGTLAVGDVILGVGGKAFSYDPRTEFGKALTVAESDAGGGNLSLLRWRGGKTETVVVKLPVLGTYSATAPYDCPKSRRILELGCQALAKRIAQPNYRENAITRSLNALALLAGGNPEYLPLVRKEAHWAAGFSCDHFQTWYYGYVISFLAEYKIATGDESVMPGLRRLALEAANGQSLVGSWGHGFAEPDGRVGGYGMMNAPGVPLTSSLILARKAEVDDVTITEAIARSARLLHFYAGKGCLPYGDHAPWIQTHDDNGKNGMAAVMFNLLGDAKAAEYFSRMAIASHGNERDYGHTGNFLNILWAMPSVAQSGPNATGAWMEEFGAWYFDLARCWDGAFVHQGGEPMIRPDKYKGWDCTGGYMLAYAMPLKKTYLTGKGQNHVPQISMAEAKSVVDDGRGWTRRDRNSFYDSLTTDQLIARLGNWSPVVRQRAAEALARRNDHVMDRLIGMLDAKDLDTRYGACRAIRMQKDRGAPAVPALLATFRSDDLWLRILAAEALAGIGEPAKSAAPEMLERLTKHDPKNDPRNMEQRYLSFALFDKGSGLLSQSLEGVDRELLGKAVRAGLKNDDGRARGSFVTVYDNLTFKELEPLLPAIIEAVVERSPSGIMFSDNIRTKGLELLAKHHIAEAMPLCIDIMDIERWGKNGRIMGCLKALEYYKGAAKPLLPRLLELEKQLVNHREAKMLQPHAELLRKVIADIKTDENPPKLRSIGDS
jgi:hypothetical protein